MFPNCSFMTDMPPVPEMSEDEFNAKLAKSVAESAARMKTLEQARRESAALRESNDAVDDLRRLREVLMEHVERTDRQARSLLRLDEYEACDKDIDPGIKCIRLGRAVRQTIVLQQELLGLRPAPGARMSAARKEIVAEEPEQDDDHPPREDMRDRERENLHDGDDTYDYDDRPYDQVIASIRDTFKIPAEAKPASKRRAPIPAATPEAPVAALAGGAEPAAYSREHGPP